MQLSNPANMKKKKEKKRFVKIKLEELKLKHFQCGALIWHNPENHQIQFI